MNIMKILIKNVNLSVSLSLTALRLVGFWAPELLVGTQRLLYNFYSCFSFMFLLGTYLIIQLVDLFMIWGNLPLMTGVAFVLFTNLAQAAKIANLLARKDRIRKIITEADAVLGIETSGEGREIVKRCDRQTIFLQVVFLMLTLITTTGWASSAEKGQLPLRAWYPYNTSKSPAYEFTYLHQVGAINIAACLNVGKDTLVSALIAQCRCRLQLLGLSLRTLCRDLEITNKMVFTPAQEKVVTERLRKCVKEHQSALEAAVEIQGCFSEPTFFQFIVSLVIICVTAFQLISAYRYCHLLRLRKCVRKHQSALDAAVEIQRCFSAPTFFQFIVSLVICVTAFQLISQTGNLVRLFSMGTYLLNMMFQVFIYCYQGHHLSEESADVAGYAYECPWYACSVRIRKMILIVMTRTRRVAKLSAGGFTTLSLASFMAIIKASYSLFTLLQQVTE